jgi:alpha-beta hydrolase superfamily lysophospholipase
VTFDVDGVTVHGSLRIPSGSGPFPAAVLLAGSGPTDRNGDSRLINGSIGTLRHLADVLARNGVATLRYDKLGSGSTGLGGFAADPGALGFDTYTAEAAAALRLLAGSRHVDPRRLVLIGHSEGGLIALATATTAELNAPALVGVGLLESLPMRYHDLFRIQIRAQLAAAAATGRLSAEQVDSTGQALDDAIVSLRTTGRFPTAMPDLLTRFGLTPAVARFLYQADRLDPVALAARLPASVAVLQTCAAKDVQVTCDQQQGLRAALDARGRHTWVRLENTDHVLKDIGTTTSTGAEYGQDLPFSPTLDTALAGWVARLGR